MIASDAGAQTANLSNGPNATWELIRRDGDRHCFLRTKIQDEAPLDTIDLDRPLGGRKVELRIHGPATGQPVSSVAAEYLVGDRGRKTQQVVEHDVANSRRVFGLEFVGEDAAAISQGAGIKLAIASDQLIAIETSKVPALLQQLDACTRDYFVELGVDPKLVAEVAIEPYADDSIISPDDYPAAALRKGEQGTALALAMVDRIGAIRDCRIVVSSKSLALDYTTCQLLRRATLKPGLDTSGRPVEAPQVFAIHWVLP